MSNVLKPEIIGQRIKARDNLWNTVNKINKLLSTNTVEEDRSIIVTIPVHTLSTIFLAQIIELYQAEGWNVKSVVDVKDIVLTFSEAD